MRFNLNQLSNREQILIVGLIFLIFFISAIFMISWLNNQNKNLEKENQNIISRLNYIESIPVSVASNRNFYSNNISILEKSIYSKCNLNNFHKMNSSYEAWQTKFLCINFADLEYPEYLTNDWYLSGKNILFVLFFASCTWSDKNDAQNS